MDSKTLFAFALGCFAAGGVLFLFSGTPAPKTPIAPREASAPAVPAATDAAPVATKTEEPAAVVPEPTAPEAPAPVERPKPQAKSWAAASKPSPREKTVRVEPERSVAMAKAEEKSAPVTATPASPAAPATASAPRVDLPPPPASPTPAEPVAVVKKEIPTPPPPPKPNTVTIAAGTMLSVRLQEALSTDRNMAGDTFQAVLEQPVIVDGFVIAEKGSRVEGKVLEVDRGGKVKGVARLLLELTRINTSDGQRVAVQTSAFERKAETSKKSDAVKVGLGAAIGAAIGGIAGGGKGAATGAGVGGAAGAGQVLLTRGKDATLAVETRLSFRLQEPITLTERLNN